MTARWPEDFNIATPSELKTWFDEAERKPIHRPKVYVRRLHYGYAVGVNLFSLNSEIVVSLESFGFGFNVLTAFGFHAALHLGFITFDVSPNSRRT